jgi:hypothetical protein
LPGNASVSFQAEAPALLRTPQTPAPSVVQEIFSEPEQNLAPVQGIKHEVSTRAQSCHLVLSMNHS